MNLNNNKEVLVFVAWLFEDVMASEMLYVSVYTWNQLTGDPVDPWDLFPKYSPFCTNPYVGT